MASVSKPQGLKRQGIGLFPRSLLYIHMKERSCPPNRDYEAELHYAIKLFAKSRQEAEQALLHAKILAETTRMRTMRQVCFASWASILAF